MQAKFLQRKRGRVLLLSLIMIASTGIFVLIRKPFAIGSLKRNNFICNYPKYSSVRVGMTKEQVTRLLGISTSARIKDNAQQNFFYQGDNQQNIYEGWIYDFSGWTGNIEVYFDSSGRVNGKNCGVG